MSEETNTAQIVLYQSDGANVPIEVYYKDENLWASQAAIADLFGVSISTVSDHLRNIFNEGELENPSVTSFPVFPEKPPPKEGGRKLTTTLML